MYAGRRLRVEALFEPDIYEFGDDEVGDQEDVKDYDILYII